MTAADPFAHVRDERLRRLTAYWLGKRAGRLMPAPRDIDAVEIPALLPYLWIYDFLPEARRFRCRLAGDEVNMLLGLSLRGRYLEEIAPPVALPLARERFLGVVDTPAISHAVGTMLLASDRRVPGERMIFPLSSDGSQVDRVLGITVCALDRIERDGAVADMHMHETRTPVAALPGA
jgi:hypothetical protein